MSDSTSGPDASVEIRLPDIGDFPEVEVIEILASVGDQLGADDTVVVIESDKASMEVPAGVEGTITSIAVEIGAMVSTGDLLAVLTASAPSGTAPRDATTGDDEPEPTRSTPTIEPENTQADAGPADTQSQADPDPAPSRTAPGRESPLPASDMQTDVVVIGAGPGGYTAAFRAADLGLRTILVERYPTLGGVCLNVGCIPSKTLLHAAEVVDAAAQFSTHGIKFSPPKIDLPKLAAFKDSVVGKLTQGLAGLAKQRKVEIVTGNAEFEGPNLLRVQGQDTSQTIAFHHTIVAAGSQSVSLPGFPDDPRIMDSTAALALEDVPKRLLVIGGGIIGLEMATVYCALGSKVTVVELMDQLMPGCDRDLVRPLQKHITPKYEAILLNTRVTEVKAQAKGIKVSFEGADAPQSDQFDRVLVAVGRKPNGLTLGLEHAGVAVDERGFIPVDEQCRTNVAHIFAIGDIVGQPMLAHKATHQAKVAAEVIAGEKRAFEPLAIPSVAYTDPEVAWAGLTETDAKRDGVKYEKSVFPWAASGRALGIGRDEGFTKLLFDPDDGRLIGGGIVGPHAGDLIAEVALAIELGADAEDIALTIHPHPTLAETISFAAEVANGTVTDLYIPRKKTGPR